MCRDSHTWRDSVYKYTCVTTHTCDSHTYTNRAVGLFLASMHIQMCRDSHKCRDSVYIYICVTTYTYVSWLTYMSWLIRNWRDSDIYTCVSWLTCVSWHIHTWVMCIYTYVSWRAYVTWLCIHIYMSHDSHMSRPSIHMCRDSNTHTYASWLTPARQIRRNLPTFPFVCHDASMCVPWRVRVCAMTHVYVCATTHAGMTHKEVFGDISICVSWRIHVCAMMCTYVCHDSCICVCRDSHRHNGQGGIWRHFHSGWAQGRRWASGEGKDCYVGLFCGYVGLFCSALLMFW